MSLPAQTVRFGPFELDLRAAELRHNGTKTRLPEQPFQVLVALLEHQAEVVTQKSCASACGGRTLSSISSRV